MNQKILKRIRESQKDARLAVILAILGAFFCLAGLIIFILKEILG